MNHLRLRTYADTSSWKCALIAVLNVLVLALLFQPWLSATGPLGTVSANAFGQLDGSVSTLHNFGDLPDEAHITGLWGVLTGLAALVVLVSVWVYWYGGVGFSLVVGGSTANAVCVAAALLNLNANKAKLRLVASEHHETLQDALRALGAQPFGSQKMTADESASTTATVTQPALLCGIAVALTCVLVLTLRTWTSHETTGQNNQLHRLRTATEPSTWADSLDPGLATRPIESRFLARLETSRQPHESHPHPTGHADRRSPTGMHSDRPPVPSG